MQIFDSPIHCKFLMIFGCEETMIIHVFTIRSPPISSHSQHQRGDKQVAEGPQGQFQKLEAAVPVALTGFKSFLVFGLRTRFFGVGFRVVFVPGWGLVYSGLFVLVVRSLLCWPRCGFLCVVVSVTMGHFCFTCLAGHGLSRVPKWLFVCMELCDHERAGAETRAKQPPPPSHLPGLHHHH